MNISRTIGTGISLAKNGFKISSALTSAPRQSRCGCFYQYYPYQYSIGGSLSNKLSLQHQRRWNSNNSGKRSDGKKRPLSSSKNSKSSPSPSSKRSSTGSSTKFSAGSSSNRSRSPISSSSTSSSSNRPPPHSRPNRNPTASKSRSSTQTQQPTQATSRQQVAKPKLKVIKVKPPTKIALVNSLKALSEDFEVEIDYLKDIMEDISQKPLEDDVVSGELAEEAAIALEKKFVINYKKSKGIEKKFEPRAPVITIMGHVDHGKTTLLDTLRSASVAAGEAGGITQHIGAFQVKSGDQLITFIDTPGHAAFEEMRRQGAVITDIIVLVVAADDGVQPQTREVLKHAREHNVPFIIAINKIDAFTADPEKTKQDLLVEGVELEEFDGDVQCVEISGKDGTNVPDLLESLALQAELMELKADVAGFPEAVVFESRIDKAMGPVASILNTSGKLKIGDILIADDHFCKVRALRDWKGQNVKFVGPSDAVDVTGWRSLPDPGTRVQGVESTQAGHRIIAGREKILHRRALKVADAVKRELRTEVADQIKEDETIKKVRLIVKGDVYGTVDALKISLLAMKNSLVQVEILKSGVGSVHESEAELAGISKATIIAFNVPVEKKAIQMAQKEKVEIIKSKIIYEIIDKIHEKLDALMPEITETTKLGTGTCKATFQLNQRGHNVVGGCSVNSGMFKSDGIYHISRLNIERKPEIVFEGPAISLKHFKDEVAQVNENMECGLIFEFDLQAGDKIECFESIQVTKKFADYKD